MTSDALAQVRQWAWTSFALVLALAFLAQYARIGGDWDWLVAMGDHIRRTGEVPDNVPFAEAPTDGWHNVPVLGETVASLLHRVDPRMPVLTHLVAVAGGLIVLADTARRRGARDGYVALCLALTVVSCFASLVVVRAQVWSLLLFPLLIALVCSQWRRPDSRIWWAVPLVAVWGNLHGAALLGVCFLGAYLLLGRLRARPAETLAVGLASVLALGMNPQLWRTPSYYAEVFDNVSAQRAEGLWARPDVTEPIDVAMLLVIGLLAVIFLRRRHAPWEYVAVAGLAVATASAARHGVWLVFLLVVLAAAPGPLSGTPHSRRISRGVMAGVVVLALIVAAPVALRRGDRVLGASTSVVANVAAVSEGGVVLAPAPLSESLAVARIRVWATNPLDAFKHADQAAYLDFLAGAPGARRALDGSDVVVVQPGTAPELAVAGRGEFAPQPCGEGWVCYVRVR